MVIPIGDINPVRRSPWITRLLLAANIAVFLFVQPIGQGLCARQQFFVRAAAVPAELVRGEPLSAAELTTGPYARCELQPAPQKPVYATLMSSMFLHADIWHLLGNMLYLWIFGNNVEDRLGRARFLGLYLLWGFVGTVAFVAANPDAIVALVGASGAIAGVLGSYLVMFPSARVTVLVLFLFTVQVPAVVVLGLWFLLQLREAGGPAVGGGGGVAYLAHVGGFLAGAVATLLLGQRPQRRRHRRPRRWR